MLNKWISTIIIALLLFTGIAFAADKIDINTATVEQLQVINGVGASTADAIIQYRQNNGPFMDINDLVNVKGIGDKKLEKIIDQIMVTKPE